VKVRAQLLAMGATAAVADRVAARVARSCPDAPGAFHPARLAREAADALGLPGPRQDALADLVGGFYGAVDAADDIADGDADDPVIAAGDVHRLLLLLVSRATEPGLGPAAAELARTGVQMWQGQEADLRTAHAALSEDAAWRIAEQKSGAELAGVLRAVAAAAGAPSDPLDDFGRQLGTLVQLWTDLEDLFGRGASRDLRDGRCTLPIAHALAHPAAGPALRWALAAGEPEAELRGLLAEARLDQWLSAVLEGRGRALRAAAHATPIPDAATRWGERVLREVDGWRAYLVPEVATALPPDTRAASQAHDRAATLEAWLATDPALAASVERVRRPDGAVWCAAAFGRLLALELAGPGLPLPAVRSAARAALGRTLAYFEGPDAPPPDADQLGLALAVLGPEAPDGAAERLVDGVADDGWVPTWLGDDPRWTQARCPITQLHAWRGLRAVGAPRTDDALSALVRQVQAEGPTSPYYADGVARGLLAWELALHAPGCALLPGLLERLHADADRLLPAHGPLVAALAALALHAADPSGVPPALHGALLRDGAADGGPEAAAVFQTVPGPNAPRWYRSRGLPAVALFRALRTLSPPTLVPPRQDWSPTLGAAVGV
jgi:hypothetical protein